MEGSVPTPNGSVSLRMDGATISVNATEGHGYLYFRSADKPSATAGTIEPTTDGGYRLHVEAGRPVTVSYTPETNV